MTYLAALRQRVLAKAALTMLDMPEAGSGDCGGIGEARPAPPTLPPVTIPEPWPKGVDYWLTKAAVKLAHQAEAGDESERDIPVVVAHQPRAYERPGRESRPPARDSS